MTKILTADELVEFTGSKSAKKQIEMFTQHGIKFVTRTDGKIRTTWSAIDSVLNQKTKAEEQEPDLSFLRHG